MDETIDDLAEWYERAVDERGRHDHSNDDFHRICDGARPANEVSQTNPMALVAVDENAPNEAIRKDEG
jgi:hypothetical protein